MEYFKFRNASIFGLMWECVSSFRLYVSIALIGSVISTILNGYLIPYFVQMFLSGVMNRNFSFFTKGVSYAITFIMLTSLAMVLFWYIGECAVGNLRAKTERKMRVEIFDIVQRYNLSFFQMEGGEGILENSIDCIAEGVGQTIHILITEVIPKIILIIVVFCQFIIASVWIFLLALIAFLSFVIMYYNFIFKSVNILKEHTKIASQRSHLMIDSFKNQLVKRVYQLEDSETDRLSNLHKTEEDLYIKSNNVGAFYDSLIYIICNILYLSTFQLVLSYINIRGFIVNPEQVLLLVHWNYHIIKSFTNVLEQISDIKQEISQVVQSVTTLLKGEREVNVGVLTPKIEGDIEIKDLKFSYKDNVIFDRLSLKIPKGSSLVIVGLSGVGKTTLLNILAKTQLIANDSVFIDGYDLNSIDTTHMRKHLTYITQANMMFNMSVRDNIKCGDRYASDQDINRALQEVGLYDLIHALPEGLDTMMGNSGSRFSGGQIQRIAIARALLHNKSGNIFLSDEPVSSVDKINGKHIIDTIMHMTKNHTIIIVDHSMQVPPLADQVLFLQQGKYLIGSHMELLQSSREYAKFFNSIA